MLSTLNDGFKKIKTQKSIKPIVAFGADLKSTFSLSKEKQIFLSPVFGDLADPSINQSYTRKLNSSLKSHKIKPKYAVCDLHPTYFSTRLAEEFSSAKKIPLKRIQHHHAHIASCCLENDFQRPVLGVSFDGTGFGEDGAIWGGEFLLVNKSGFRRLAHLDYVDLPGGDLAAQEPWRMGLAYLYSLFSEKIWDLKINFIKDMNKKKAKLILDMIRKNINNYQTSSMGRLFDAVASIMGICQVNEYEAQAPQLLEKCAHKNLDESYHFKILDKNHKLIINVKPLIRDIVNDIMDKQEKGIISAKFHNTIAYMTREVLRRLSKKTKIKDVALSGGVFQNKLLLEKLKNLLKEDRFKVLEHKTTPSDASIPLGQIQVVNRSK